MKLLSRPSDLINAASPMSPNPSPLSLELPSTAVPQHSGLVGSFWMQSVPALLRANSSVKYANLAIHALIDSKRPQWVEEGPKLPGRDSYSRALRYHGQAIGAVREKTASRESLQSATLCSLFFIIFEMMNGDVNAAQAHMYNGCRMMAELRGATTGQPVNGVESMLFRELQKALRFVAMQVQGAVSNYEESKPVKTEVEVKAEPKAEPKAEVEADVDVCKKEEKEVKEEEEEEAKPSIGLDAIKIKQEPHTPLPTD